MCMQSMIDPYKEGEFRVIIFVCTVALLIVVVPVAAAVDVDVDVERVTVAVAAAVIETVVAETLAAGIPGRKYEQRQSLRK